MVAQSAQSRNIWPWLIVLSGALPLLAAAPAPLMDWPSHLARVWITRRVLDGDAFWRARYQLGGFLIPNAILDLGVLGLLRLGLSMAQAGTIFLLLVYATFIGGAYRLAGQIRTASKLTLPLAVTCFYSTLLFYGLVNFIAGLAAMLWALSFWCRWAERPWRRVIVAVVASAAIALCHIIALAVFLGVIVCLDVAAFYQARVRRAAALVPLSAALLIAVAIVALSAAAAGGEGELGFNSGGTLAGLLHRKAVIAARAMSSGQLGPDLVMALTAAVLALAAWRAWAGIAMPWAVASFGLLGLAAIAPDKIGEGAFFDARLVPAALVLLAVAVPLRRVHTATVLVLGALVMLRMAWLTAEWRRAGQLHSELEAELARLPAGSVLLAGFGTPGDQISWADEWSSPSGNIASLAAAHNVFVPSVFASAVQQPLSLREPWRVWRDYLDVSTPDLAQGLLDRVRPNCGAPVNLLVLHFRAPDWAGTPPYALFGPPMSRIALIHLC